MTINANKANAYHEKDFAEQQRIENNYAAYIKKKSLVADILNDAPRLNEVVADYITSIDDWETWDKLIHQLSTCSILDIMELQKLVSKLQNTVQAAAEWRVNTQIKREQL